MRKQIGFLAATVGVVFLVAGCSGDSLFNASVAFENESASKTVCAIWDGVSTGAISPGNKTDYRAENDGSHTIKWTDCHGTDLTKTAWPNLVSGGIYTFPYKD